MFPFSEKASDRNRYGRGSGASPDGGKRDEGAGRSPERWPTAALSRGKTNDLSGLFSSLCLSAYSIDPRIFSNTLSEKRSFAVSYFSCNQLYRPP